MELVRKIIHLDMDAFYASVEQLDNPELLGKPIAVGGKAERGVVAAASYEARKYGVRSAMPGKIAALKCPQLIFIKPRFERYKEISAQIRSIFMEYTDLVEPLSLDEAYLDVTHALKGPPSATLIALEIRSRIKTEIGLNASAGISYNKFLAKVASDLNKPNGQAVILPHQAEEFLEKLPIEKFYGIGEKTAEKMKRFGIYQGAQLKEFSLQFLVKHFGKSGAHYFDIVRGIHSSEVKPNRIRKSISAEQTFLKDLQESAALEQALNLILEDLLQRLDKANAKGRTLTLKIKYRDFSSQTRSKSLLDFIPEDKIWDMALELLNQAPLEQPVRLLGLGISNMNLSQSFNPQLKIAYPGF